MSQRFVLHSKATQCMEGSRKTSNKTFPRGVFELGIERQVAYLQENRDVIYKVEIGKVGGSACL